MKKVHPDNVSEVTCSHCLYADKKYATQSNNN